MAENQRFEPGTLWARIVARSQTARARGALHPIETEMHIVEDRGVQFQVRIVSSLVRKKQASAEARRHAARTGKPVNPFLPYEEDLYVADASRTHVCLLNKYNVIDHHLLLITRDYEAQETPLTRRDFEALWTCMNEYDALGFYNSAPVAGASQPHKHLQLVPLPLGASRLPVESLLTAAEPPGVPTEIRSVPFANAYASLDATRLATVNGAAAYTFDLYRSLLAAVGLATSDVLPAVLAPYNLLVTRDFLWIIPRSRSHCGSVAVNALGFAGSFFSADAAAVALIRSTGPLALLREVAVAASRD